MWDIGEDDLERVMKVDVASAQSRPSGIARTPEQQQSRVGHGQSAFQDYSRIQPMPNRSQGHPTATHSGPPAFSEQHQHAVNNSEICSDRERNVRSSVQPRETPNPPPPQHADAKPRPTKANHAVHTNLNDHLVNENWQALHTFRVSGGDQKYSICLYNPKHVLEEQDIEAHQRTCRANRDYS